MEGKMEEFIKKIYAPVICIIDGKKHEYENGVLALRVLPMTGYNLQSVSVQKEKIVLNMTGKTKYDDEKILEPRIASCSPNGEWAREYKEQFGEEPGFF